MSIEEIISICEKALKCLAGSCQMDCKSCQYNVDPSDALSAWTEAVALLRTHPDNQPNEPLTLEELREMARQPVWVECKHFSGWAILYLAWPEIFVVAADGNTYFIWTNGKYNGRLGAKLYRRPPKEEK